MESMKHGPASWKGPIKGIKRAERERESYRILIHGVEEGHDWLL